jgi:hypothetical protein
MPTNYYERSPEVTDSRKYQEEGKRKKYPFAFASSL